MDIQTIRQQFPQYNDMSDGDLADALHSKFYADLPRAEFDQKIGGGAPPAQPAPQNTADIGVVDMGLRGATLGLNDYVRAAGVYLDDRVPLKIGPIGADINPTWKKTYDDSLREVRQSNEAYRESDPVKAYGSEIVGGVVSPLFTKIGLAKGGPGNLGPLNVSSGPIPNIIDSAINGAQRILGKTIPGLAGKTLPRYAGYGLQGGAAGAAFGVGNAQSPEGGIPSAGDMASSVGQGALGGAAMGVAVPAVAEGAARLIGGTSRMIAKQAPAMTQEQIANASRQAYKASEDAGVVVRPEAFKDFVDNLPSQLEGFHPRVATKTADVLGVLQEEAASGVPITLQNLDNLRKVASGASKTMDRNEVRLISSVVNHLDDFIEGLNPGQLAAGDAPAAVSSLKEARGLWRTNAKLRNINDIVEIGENLNDPNWTRNQFRAIVRKPRQFNQYSADEQDIIKNIARTGNLELLARLQPLRGVQMAAPHIANVGQQNDIGRLQDLIARGGVLPPSRIALPGAPLSAAARLPSQMLSPFMTGSSNQ